MKLAETIIITLADEEFELRPSLRYALQLERREGSFRQLLHDISEGSLTAAIDIVTPHADGLPFLKNRVFDALPTIRPQLVAYVLACMGVDPDAPEAKGKAKSGKARPYSDFLTDLYKLGTGWLDWSPEQTLDATPLEINLAFAGKREMLKAIYGGSTKADKSRDEQSTVQDPMPLGEKFRMLLSVRKAAAEAEAVQRVAEEIAE